MKLASSVLLMRPAAFGFSEEAAGTNVFQRRSGLLPAEIAARARTEVDGVATALRAAGVHVTVVEDTADPPKPDAVFPNNWFSAEDGGVAVLYPMAVTGRRAERRPEIFTTIAGFSRIVDLSHHEGAGGYLEGTGSLVLDRARKVAFACLSPRTTPDALQAFGDALGFRIVPFRATLDGADIYHTNVVLALTPDVAVLGVECVEDPDPLVAALDREIVTVTADQIRRFTGNLLALQGRDGPVALMSRTAHDAFTPAQLARLPPAIVVDIPTIEEIGGGSARCMVAELW